MKKEQKYKSIECNTENKSFYFSNLFEINKTYKKDKIQIIKTGTFKVLSLISSTKLLKRDEVLKGAMNRRTI